MNLTLVSMTFLDSRLDALAILLIRYIEAFLGRPSLSPYFAQVRCSLSVVDAVRLNLLPQHISPESPTLMGHACTCRKSDEADTRSLRPPMML